MADWWDQLKANHGAYLERGGLPGVIWGMLPPEARRAFEPWGQLLNPLEWTPGAGVRDTLEASGNLTRATLEGRPLGMLNALGGMALGIASIPPGGAPVAKTAKEIAKLPMDVASRLARAADMGVDRTLAARFGTAPEGEKLAGAALKTADGRVFTGPTHVDAMEDVESKLRRSWFDLPHAPIPEGFVTDSGRYVSRREAADISDRQGQGQTTKPFGAQYGLAAEDVAHAPPLAAAAGPRTATTDPGLPGGEGIWGRLVGRSPDPVPGSPTSASPAMTGAGARYKRPPATVEGWPRTTNPGTAVDAQDLSEVQIQNLLRTTWANGHDSLMLKNYTRPGSKTPESVIVLRDMNQVRDPKRRPLIQPEYPVEI